MFSLLQARNIRSALSGTKLIVLTMLGFVGAAAFASSKPIADHPSTCFKNNIDHPYAPRIARNTVFLARLRPDGTLVSAATAFLVHNSATDEPRIVTAAHVVADVAADKDASDATLMLFLSDGTPLGIPRIIVATSQQQISIDDSDLIVNDLAVLTIVQFSDERARRRLSELDGLPVSSGGALMVGETSGRAGVIWGYSGAPAVDETGEVIGVAIGADFRGRVNQSLGTIQEPAPDDQQTGEIALPKRSLVVVEPLRAPAIMRALGLREHASAERSESSVVLAGFPFASCASTSARLHTADSVAGAILLKKWQQLDRTDSWWLPSLGGKKIRLVLQSQSS
jgi:hypothetical protein